MWYKVICEYWSRHELINWKYTCNCCTQFWYSHFKLQEFCEKKYKVNYPSMITSEMRKEFYINNNK